MTFDDPAVEGIGMARDERRDVGEVGRLFGIGRPVAGEGSGEVQG
jgi:hypothetical protein